MKGLIDMGKFKKDYVGDSPYIDYTSNAASVTEMGIARIPCSITESTYTLNMPFREIAKLMENNICVASTGNDEGGQNDLCIAYNNGTFSIYMISGAELTAADADSYPTSAE